MSHTLGPIHYWLYGKIGKQEELTNRIAVFAENSGWISDCEAYVKKLPPLEEVIDEGNIHGWLQECISDAETRYADLITAILKQDNDRIKELTKLAYDFGVDNALPAETTPEEAYKSFKDFFVNGMPCDRINTLISNDENSVSWQQTRDIHAQYWKDVAPYYILRNSVMDGMLQGTKLHLSVGENVYTISK